jgi:hypothetical protein
MTNNKNEKNERKEKKKKLIFRIPQMMREKRLNIKH